MLDSSDDVMYAAKADGEIIGIANVSRLKRRMSHRASIGISVRQCAWHSGVGTALMGGAPCFRPEKRHRTTGTRGALR